MYLSHVEVSVVFSGTAEFIDAAAGAARRFYRAVEQ